MLGVAVGDIFDTLFGYLGSSYVNQFTRFGHTFQVYVQAEGSYRSVANGIARLKVPNASGSLVPLGSVSRKWQPSLISLYNLHPATSIIGRPQSNISSGEAMGILEKAAAQVLPAGRPPTGPGFPIRKSLPAVRTISFSVWCR